MKALIIFNSFSGSKGKHKKIEYIKKELCLIYDSMDFFSSSYLGNITDIIKEKSINYDTLIIIGGDGTIHEAINAIIKYNPNINVGFIPFGTCNDFSKNVTYKNIKKALLVLKNNKTRKISITKVNDTYMTYALAFGAFSNASYEISSNLKSRFKILSYYLNGIKIIFSKIDKPIVEGKKYFLGIVSKTNYLAGKRLRNKSNTYTDYFEYKLIRINNRFLGLFSFGIYLFFNIGKREKISNLDINFDEYIDINIDGELALNTKNLHLEVEKDKLNIISK